MKAAVCRKFKKPLIIEDIQLAAPGASDIKVKIAACGICHSDIHFIEGAWGGTLPAVYGHEGAGIVQEVGPGVTDLAPGDRVIFSFIPSCGQCRACASGMGSLCEIGRYNREGRQISDHTARHHARGQDLGLMCLLGTFAEHTVVHQASCVKIEDDLPLDIACLLGCGVITGWGSVAYTGEARVGDVVAVVGVGGIGINAVQAAVAVGAEYVVAVDPVAFKRSKALEFGASHAVASSQEAAALLTDLTRGRMAQVCVNTMGVGDGDQIGASLGLVGKRGRVVVTNIHPAAETKVAMSALELTTYEKQVRGSLFGSCNPRSDIPRMLELYRSGKLKLEELRTRTYGLDEVNIGYEDMRNGRNLRGVITF